MIFTPRIANGRTVWATAAAVLFCAISGAGSRFLDVDQVWIFQRMMFLVMSGLVVVFSFGRQLSLPASKGLDRLNGWLLENPARSSVLLGVFVSGYFLLWCVISFLRHYYFHSSYDLAIMDQVVWNTAQGRPFARSIEDGLTNDFGDHVRPYLAALSLFYLVIASPYVLLATQALILALSALPMYSLARRKFDSPAIGLAAAVCVLAYPPIGFLNRYDFHVEVLSIPLLIGAYERIDGGDLKSASLFMVLTLFSKENLGLTVAALGITAGLWYRHWRFGLTWALIGLAYSALAFLVVIPAFRGEPSDTLTRYHWLGDSPSRMLSTMISQPAFVLQKLFAVEHILTVLQLLAPLAFLSLLSLPALMPALPTLLYNFLAEWPSQTTIYNHYMAPVIPFIAVAAVFGLQRFVNFQSAGFPSHATGGDRRTKSIGLGVTMIIIATLTSWVYQNPVTGNASLLWGTAPEVIPMGKKTPVPLIWPNDTAIREGLRHVPSDVAVLTTANYAPHLSHRAWIEMIPRAPVRTLGAEAEVIFLNLRDLRWWGCNDYFENLKAAARLNFGVIFYRDDTLVVQKDRGDTKKLNEVVDRWPACQ